MGLELSFLPHQRPPPVSLVLYPRIALLMTIRWIIAPRKCGDQEVPMQSMRSVWAQGWVYFKLSWGKLKRRTLIFCFSCDTTNKRHSANRPTMRPGLAPMRDNPHRAHVQLSHIGLKSFGARRGLNLVKCGGSISKGERPSSCFSLVDPIDLPAGPCIQNLKMTRAERASVL